MESNQWEDQLRDLLGEYKTPDTSSPLGTNADALNSTPEDPTQIRYKPGNVSKHHSMQPIRHLMKPCANASNIIIHLTILTPGQYYSNDLLTRATLEQN